MEKEENFYELLDEYLDSEEIESKKKLDKEQEEKENSIFSDSPFSIEDTITLNDFVNNFLMIKCDASNLYHSGLKDLNCPYVVGVSNDFANKNPELVKQGYLLIVIDCKKHRGTYINPVYLKKVLDKNDIEKEYEMFGKKRIHDLRKLEQFYTEYIILKNQVETNEQFYNLLAEQRKLRKIKDIKKYEEMGGIENDKYKRR